MAKRSKFLTMLLLYPISVVYGWVMAVRNAMFEHGLLKQREFDIPVISVGNISMGGTGKTPHTEYIVDMLKDRYHMGVLSRGYKRKTKGFVQATKNSHVDDIGDEPYQIYHKFRKYGVMMAVCENRVEGIEQMREIDPALNLIVLDDAFQHRYVKPAASVVLMEWSRPAFQDHLLPYGHLREPMGALNRADVVIVTKCPDDMKPVECRIFRERLELFPYQKLLFSRYEYEGLKPLFPDDAPAEIKLEDLTREDTILVVCGVANPRPFVKYLRTYMARIKIKRYADHHHFTHADMESILQKFNLMKGRRKIVVTTEKDGVRLVNNPYFPHKLRKCTYYLPIKVGFTDYSDCSLDTAIESVIRNNRFLK
ncbi:MAG: tetraacyldisaccharide 4'-kinase [Muribaculaceae bacterium]|nr:tetraacyldisaccharide 4'-kinase [Muribaculaceae bacterium]